MNRLKKNIKSNKIKTWEDVHFFYQEQGAAYDKDVCAHAYTSLLELLNITPRQFTAELFKKLLTDMLQVKEKMVKGIYEARAKDYTNPYRRMVYENMAEMEQVIGKLENNSFIQDQMKELDQLKKTVNGLIKKWKLK